MVSPVKREEEKVLDSRDRAARLMEVMNSVDAVQEVVQNVRGARPTNGRTVAAESKDDTDSGKRRNSGTSAKYADDIKAVQQLEDRFPLVPEDKVSAPSANGGDDDLEATLDNWLENQMRNNVTMRHRRPGQGAAIVSLVDDEADIVNEEDGMSLYSTVTKSVSRYNVPANDYAADEFDDYGDDMNGESFDVNKPLRGQVMGDDVEVVGMQCMLAKALMGDDEDDQEYDFGIAGRK